MKLQGPEVHSAIGQVEKYAIDQGMQSGSDQIDGGLGKVTIVAKDPDGGHDYPLLAAAQKASGRVADGRLPLCLLAGSHTTLNLNIATEAFNSFACDSRALAAAAACSTKAAFCCVTPSICVTAWLI